MLQGAMAELRLGNPGRLAVDVGPVIDTEARDRIHEHIAHMQACGHAVHQPAALHSDTAHGSFVAPTLIEIPHLGVLSREVFGPVLHVVRYARHELGALMAQINATGYGLTLGVHSRIDETIAQITDGVHAGNQYVNRNMVGAVVGVQPFGGEGLSGTGPKAGGPLYLYRLLAHRPADALQQALRFVGAPSHTHSDSPADVAAAKVALPGPTGERNLYRLVPRRVLRTSQPLTEGEQASAFDSVVFDGDARALRMLLAQLAQRPGPIVNVYALSHPQAPVPAEALWAERSLSINTAAAGGNASLMTLA